MKLRMLRGKLQEGKNLRTRQRSDLLALPPQEQDGSSMRVVGMSCSPRMQANAYSFRPTSSDDPLRDGHFYAPEESAMALAFHLFHPSQRCHSTGSATHSRPRMANGFVQNFDVSNPRSCSVPRGGYGCRRADGTPAMLDRVLSTPLCDPESGNDCNSQRTGQVLGRYLPKALVGATGLGRTRSLRVCKSEGDGINAAENTRIARTGSGGKTPVVTILHRAKDKDMALPNLGKLLACEESPSVFPSVGEVSRDSTSCTADEFPQLHAEAGATSPISPELIETYHLPCSSHRHTDGLEGTHNGFNFTDSNTSTDDGCRREDNCSSSSLLMNDERWAGPAYSNSPPPSSLPFPKFSIRQLRTSSLEIPLSEFEPCDDAFGSGSLSAPATPSRSLFTVPCESSLTAGFLGLGLDVANATKDLRRILNLDAKT